jgi:hypothetical protein
MALGVDGITSDRAASLKAEFAETSKKASPSQN